VGISQTPTGAAVPQVSFYIDQNCSPALAALLQQLGYRATTAAQQSLSRALDNDQLLFAARQSAVLITRDRIRAGGCLPSGSQYKYPTLNPRWIRQEEVEHARA